MDSEVELERIAAWIRQARRVMVLTGAGISTESGIPDFRGPHGVWTKDPGAERMSNLRDYLREPELRRRAWRVRLDHPGWAARPNAGHFALAELERRGRLHALVTQNIDGLHQMAGSSSGGLIEMHGTMREVVCMTCGERAPMQRALDRVRAGEEDPPCRSCGGILKSATISFGQSLIAADMERARRAAETCNVFIAIGTTLAVYPVAHLPLIALDRGARLVIMNAQPTPLDDRAAAVVRAPLGHSLPALVRSV